MAGDLVPISNGEVAWNGKAEFEVIPDIHSSVELWERVVPFGATAPLPDFAPAWSGSSSDLVQASNLPMGSLYQVRLYDAGDGRRSGDGRVHSALEFPSLWRNGQNQVPIFDRCMEAPQIEFFPGGTFTSASVAVCPSSMVRIQLGSDLPTVGSEGLGVFDTPKMVSSAVSIAPNNMHRLDVTSRPFDRVPLLPGNEYWYVVLAWNSDGLWDYAWTTAEVGQPPGILTLKRRRVVVKLADLFIVDDSDDLSPGEATFKLVVKRGQTQTNTQSFGATVDSGHQVIGIPPFMKVDTGLEKIDSLLEGDISVKVTAHEDDSGSFPPDSDDHSHAFFGSLNLPSGPAEYVSNQATEVTSTVDSGNPFIFRAQVIYSVTYE